MSQHFVYFGASRRVKETRTDGRADWRLYLQGLFTRGAEKGNMKLSIHAIEWTLENKLSEQTNQKEEIFDDVLEA